MGKVKEEIARYLKKNRLCVLCACSKNTPRATPVGYTSEGLTVNIYSEKFTSKFTFLEKNRNVALGIYNVSRPDRGLQLWGKAEIISHEDPRHYQYLSPRAKKNPKIKILSKIVKLIQVTPYKIVMVDATRKGNHFLKWELDQNGKEREKEIKTLRKASQL